jgi:hypothetical protein
MKKIKIKLDTFEKKLKEMIKSVNTENLENF